MFLRTHTVKYDNEEYYVDGDSQGELKWRLRQYFNLPEISTIDGDSHEYAEFIIETGQLYITSLHVQSDINQCHTIRSVEPIDDGLGFVKYTNLRARLDFTGAFVFGNPEDSSILNYDILFRANCIGEGVKGVEDFSEKVIATRQHVYQLKQDFYREDTEYSKTSKQKRLFRRKLVKIHNQFSEQIYGSEIHNYPLHLDIRIKPSTS